MKKKDVHFGNNFRAIVPPVKKPYNAIFTNDQRNY